jgi:hypothetical protein
MTIVFLIRVDLRQTDPGSVFLMDALERFNGNGPEKAA